MVLRELGVEAFIDRASAACLAQLFKVGRKCSGNAQRRARIILTYKDIFQRCSVGFE